MSSYYLPAPISREHIQEHATERAPCPQNLTCGGSWMGASEELLGAKLPDQR